MRRKRFRASGDREFRVVVAVLVVLLPGLMPAPTLILPMSKCLAVKWQTSSMDLGMDSDPRPKLVVVLLVLSFNPVSKGC